MTKPPPESLPFYREIKPSEMWHYKYMVKTDAMRAASIEAASPRRTGLGVMALYRSELANLPEPEPLIENTLDKRTVALLSGYWGTGKSFLALDWAACLATGKPWQGRRVAPAAGPVVYIAGEGAFGLHQRLSAWEKAWRHEIPDAGLRVIPRPPNLLHAPNVSALSDWISDLRPSLVIVDTLARCAVGMEENSAKDMGLVINNLYRLRDASDGGSVLVVHHTGKDKVTSRGSSALEAGVDTVYLTEGEQGAISLKRTKRKDGATEDRMTLKLDTVKGTESVVIVSAQHADTTPSADALMSAYMSAFEGVGCSKAELRGVAAMAPATFARSLSLLVRTGRLVNGAGDHRPFYREVEA